MRFYQATRFLFPCSFELRLLTICILAIQAPLLACVIVGAATWHWPAGTVVVLLVATVIGTIAGIAAIHALLSPLTEAAAMLHAVQRGENVEEVPAAGNDLVGHLFRGVSQAVSESADRSERLRYAAERDLLTGVHNRPGFLAAAQRALTGGRSAVVGLIDLDHFGAINDHLGHNAGDSLLKEFASRLTKGVRGSDLCARWNGEEFAVLLPRATVEQAQAVMERLRGSVARHPLPGAGVTFSCGLAMVRHADVLDEAIADAGTALRAAKSSGRDRISIAG